MPHSHAELLVRCRGIATSTWSDALDSLGIRGVLRGLVQRSGRGRFVGFAVTARQRAGELGDFPRSDFGVGRMIAAANPGQALMVDMGGADISTFGGLAALATSTRGVPAVVIDGGCRDVDEIRRTDLWLASRWVTPVTGKTRLKLETIGTAVTIGGVLVDAGDLVVGDETGIVAVPQRELERVVAQAERMHASDVTIENQLRSGKSFEEAAAATGYL
jgi:regulator of RNase E activity RraA